MARRPPKYRQEARFRQEVKQGLDQLKDARRTLREATKAALRNKPVRFGEPITNADYRRMLRLEKKFGLGERISADLTPSAKRSIRKNWRDLENLFETSTFAPFPQGVGTKQKTRVKRDVRKYYPNTKERGEYREQRTTKKGIFKPTGKRQIGSVREKQSFEGKTERVVAEPNIGSLRYNRELDAWEVEVRRKTKEGLFIKERTPIAGADVLDRKRGILRRHIDNMPKPGRNQRLRFFMNGNPPNMSSQVFRTVEELFRFAEHYRKDDQARTAFLNEITIAVVQKGPSVYREVGKRGRKRQVRDQYTRVVSGFRGSNYHDVDVDDFMTEMDDDDE